ncbi:hypothetical protein PG996_012122 [Apiospora saccharicola]|uniref:Uncharacterized protein n=1 Tax=Apiospora saccharicola TaxID=335842 RepID=A0ABR1U3T1_9PEZI
MTLEGEDAQANDSDGEDLTTAMDVKSFSIFGLPSSIRTKGDLEPLKNLTAQEYASGRVPRFGKSNPEIMDVPFWSAMIAAELGPWSANNIVHYGKTGDSEPTWTFAERMGQTTTELPDGRLVFIAGEHEDFYDPDFHIYNDVCVFDKKKKNRSTSSSSEDGGGGKRSPPVLYGYPKTVFPPTDFHTATLVEGTPDIYIIGCMGYLDQRRSGETPVYRLDTRDFSMHAVKTSGEKPGWINHHNACLVEDGTAIRVWGEKHKYSGSRVYVKDGNKRGECADFEGEYLLHLETGRWTRQS